MKTCTPNLEMGNENNRIR